MARPLAPLTLTEEERETLLRWTRRPKTTQALACRARIVLACAAGRSNGEVAEALQTLVPDAIVEPRAAEALPATVAAAAPATLPAPSPPPQ